MKTLFCVPTSEIFILAMAILALKTLSAMGEDRRRYEILFRLGLGEEGRRRNLIKSWIIQLTFSTKQYIMMTSDTEHFKTATVATGKYDL